MTATTKLNERNIAALEAILQEHAERTTELMQVLTLHDFATFLASRGVLVPSVLTNEEAKSAAWAGIRLVNDPPNVDTWEEPEKFRETLERIAKGIE